MSHMPDAEGRILDWIHRELDGVGEPTNALSAALVEAERTAQHRPRRSLRRSIADRWRGKKDKISATEPEVVLVAEAPPVQRARDPVGTGSRTHGVRVALATVGTSAVVVIAVALGLGWVGEPSTDLGPGEGEVRFGSMVLEDPVAGGRDIVVARDGSGHFWTIADAVSLAVDGDRISVRPGTYVESVAVTKDLTIVGEGGPGSVSVRPAERLGPTVPAGYSSISMFEPGASEPMDPDELSSDWRYVFHLDDSDATISGLSILGARVGTAVVIDGGAPELHDVVVDAEGTQLDGRPLAPRESLSIYGGSRAIVRDSTITALLSIRDGSPVTLRENDITGTCVVVAGAGSDAVLSGNVIESSAVAGQCPRFNLVVLKGAAPTIEGNTIHGDHRTDGIRVQGTGTAPIIQGNNIAGADAGIWVGGEARGLVMRNNVTDARAGLKVVGASPQIEVNGFFENEIGVSIEGDQLASFLDNQVCRNSMNVALSDGATIALDRNPDVCPDAPTAAGPSEPEEGR